MARVADSRVAEVHLTARESPEAVALAPDRPFRILLIGDFSGRTWRKAEPPSFTPKRIDRDNFDEVLGGLSAAVDVHGMTLTFHELEDFHPDRICRSAPVFEDLDRLTVQAASAAPANGLLDQMLAEQEESSRPVSAEDANDLPAFIRRVTVGYLVPRDTPAQLERRVRRNALAGELLRGILHHPRMQAIEAAWRGAFTVVRGLETGEALHIYVLDLTLPELVSGLDAVRAELQSKGPWGVIAGNYTFGQTGLDAQVLTRLAGLASSVGAPFLAEAKIGDGEPAPTWVQLRRSAAARWIGLAAPRFLLRLPYGKDTSPIESYPFEEMPESEHNHYLWGNPSFFCAQLIGQSFLMHHWDLARRLARRIDDLPMHVYRKDDEVVTKPCAEILMSESEAGTLLEAGFMPLASVKHEAAALIVRFQSIAEPAAALAGLE